MANKPTFVTSQSSQSEEETPAILSIPSPENLSEAPPPAQSWALYAWISSALCVGVMSTALVSPLYPLYQTLYGFTNADISYIHIVYMLGVMASLLFLGNLNSYFGYWTILRAGLVMMIVGLIIMMMFATHAGLMTGRFLVGVASGMISTSTMLGMIKTIPSQFADRAPQYSSTINVIGFGLGPLLGGVIAEFFMWPLIMPYAVMILAAVAVSFQLLRKARAVKVEKTGTLKFLPNMRIPSAPVRTTFLIISFGAFLAFGIFSFFGSLATSFLHEFLNDAGPLINGISVAAVLLISGVVQFSCKSLDPRKNFLMGIGTLGLGCVVVIATILLHIPRLFIVAVVLSGIGHGLTLVASFSLLHRISTPAIKSAALSSFLFIGYFGMIIPIVISGYISDWFGINTGVITFCIMMLCLAVLLFVKTWCRRHVTI